MNDTKNFLPERKCRVCGRNFIPAPFHAYRDKHTHVAYCSWPCYNHRNDNKQTKSRAKPVEKCSPSGEVIAIYISAKEASEQNNVEAPLIRESCRTGKFYRGYLWRYKNDLS